MHENKEPIEKQIRNELKRKLAAEANTNRYFSL
jgi:hypothetical protein